MKTLPISFPQIGIKEPLQQTTTSKTTIKSRDKRVVPTTQVPNLQEHHLIW